MKFLCLICADTCIEEMAPDAAAQHVDEYEQLTARLSTAGQYAGGHRLLPAATARTLRVRGGKVTITDGPFAETKEQLGGFILLEARDQQEALQIAAQIPGAQLGCVEVRPIADDAPSLRAMKNTSTSRN